MHVNEHDTVGTDELDVPTRVVKETVEVPCERASRRDALVMGDKDTVMRKRSQSV